MPNQSPAEKAERQVVRSYQEDGVVDIQAGLSITLFGVGMTVGIPELVGLAGLTPFVGAWLKDSFTYPRIGYARLAPSRPRRRAWLTALLGVALIAGMLLYGRAETSPLTAWLARNGLAVLGVFFAAVYVVWAALLSAWRFYLYALAVLAPFALQLTSGRAPGLPLLAIGLTILAIGLVLLVRFIRRHPLVRE